ncbi:succinyldiaminopimelate transaminase [Spirillospora sp. CA-294931]|uniref:succinyldiaminopimelate transaminase n=1 Tax=Spirillospora sp. CA-294931 TaxID=3240042 RepID=UPI003D9378E4
MLTLPDFPWDRLQPYKERAAAHPDGIVDLSIGTPVDPTPEPVRAALAAAADAPGYPATYGTPALRESVAGWLRRRAGVTGADPAAVLPVIGTKELVAWLPTLLGAGPGDKVVFPELAYPTYDVGARLAGADSVATDGLLSLGPAAPKLVWVNSPSNPTGRVLPAEHLRKVVAWARERGTVVVSDECYLEFGWDEQPVSILHPDVCEGSHEGLLAVNSLSKRSNLAGYRAGIVTGDPSLVARLLEVRKHAGMIVPAPVQAAMITAFDDDAHVDEQRARYARRRAALRAAFEAHGFRIDHSEASLYLWATRDEPCWSTLDHLADLGISAAPGDFYGPTGSHHIRIAFTATDDRVEAAVTRLT